VRRELAQVVRVGLYRIVSERPLDPQVLEIFGELIVAARAIHRHTLSRPPEREKKPAGKARPGYLLWYSRPMLVAGQMQTNALLVVLLSAALAIASLRVAVYFCQRALVARDREILARLRRAAPQPESLENPSAL
jgi:hypothetical protein